MDSDRVNQISIELGHLFQQQMEALKASAVAPLTPKEVQNYNNRRERICRLYVELVELKGPVAVIR
jgi:hypothetical protein